MAIPFIIGAAAAASALYGAKKGYDGYQKHSEADDIVKSSKERYENNQSSFEEQEKNTTKVLESLGQRELEIGASIAEFKKVADKLLSKLNESSGKSFEVNVPKHDLERIENYSFSAVGVLGTIAGSGAAGAAAGFAVYGGVMALGAASTGTPIAALSGVAAKNATLAAIGGGSLKAGGLGMAGGSAILGAAVTGPVIAIAGWAYNSHGEESLRNAYKINKEVDAAVEKFGRGIKQLITLEGYAKRITQSLGVIFEQFVSYHASLKHIDSILESTAGEAQKNEKLNSLSDDVVRAVQNGFAVASILVDLISTPIFRTGTVGSKVVFEKDSDGFMVVNEAELDSALSNSMNEVESYAVTV